MMVVGGLLLVLWLIFPPVVHGQISQVQGWCSLPPPLYDQCLSNPFVGMSEPYVCQIMPYDLNNQPLFSGISYDWGISSNGSLGRFDIKMMAALVVFSRWEPGRALFLLISLRANK